MCNLCLQCFDTVSDLIAYVNLLFFQNSADVFCQDSFICILELADSDSPDHYNTVGVGDIS